MGKMRVTVVPWPAPDTVRSEPSRALARRVMLARPWPKLSPSCVEADAIVAHTQRDRPPPDLQSDVDVPAAGVTDGSCSPLP
jgi:hypothetical protein